METASARREQISKNHDRWTKSRDQAKIGRRRVRGGHLPADSTHSNARGVTQTVGRTLETPRSKVGDAIDGRSPGSRVRAFRSAFPVVQPDQWRVVSVGSSRTVAGAATACALASLAEIKRTVFPFHPTWGNRRAEMLQYKKSGFKQAINQVKRCKPPNQQWRENASPGVRQKSVACYPALSATKSAIPSGRSAPRRASGR